MQEGDRGDSIWSDLGIGIPHKVYLGSAIRGKMCLVKLIRRLRIFNTVSIYPINISIKYLSIKISYNLDLSIILAICGYYFLYGESFSPKYILF